ncbi:MAG: MFS transporter, partial [Opitutaceae bacterium]|nr:MFS transporter [Opitutaceae bacterium]
QLLESLPAAVVPLQLRWEGAGDTLIGFNGSVSSLIAFLWYPIVGAQSDRHRGRLGRRRPFLLWCILPVVLSLLLLGLAKPAGAQVVEILAGFGLGSRITLAGCTIAWVFACLLIFLLFNAYVVQVYACLVADVIPPEVLGKFAGFYRAVGALGSLAFNRWIFGWVEGHTFHVYALIGLIYATAFTLLVWRVKEGTYPPPPPKAAGGRLGAIKGYLQQCFAHPLYLNFYTITFFSWGALAPMGFMVFFATQAGKPGYADTLGLSLQQFGEIKGWTFLVQIPVFLIVGYFVDRFHPVRVAVVGMLFTWLSFLGCFWFIHDERTLLFWMCLNQGSIAIYLGAAMALGPRILPLGRYGQFVSANVIFGISSLIFAPPLVGWLLSELRNYRYVFLFSGFGNLCAFIACITLYLQWKRIGGDKNYRPPAVGGDPA